MSRDIESYRVALGKRIFRLREEAGLKQRELGRALGFESGKMVSRWELGGSLPNAAQVYDMCLELKCSADELLGLRFGVKISEAAGIRWRTVPVAANDAPGFEHEVNTGIQLFTEIMEKSRTIAELQASSQFSDLSQPAIRRFLTIALFSGALQITDVVRDQAAETALRERYGLRQCIVGQLNLPTDPVIDTTIRREVVATLTAKHTLTSLANAKSVGLVGGTTISRFVDLVSPASPELRGIRWVSLLSSKESVTQIGAFANSVVARMVIKQPGSEGYLLPFLSAMRRDRDYFSRATIDEQEELKRANYVRSLASDVEIAYISVGAPSTNFQSLDAHLTVPDLSVVLLQMTPEERENCVGDILLYFIDRNGQRIGTKEEQLANEAFVFSVGLDGLRRIAKRGLVWIVAAQDAKAPTIHASLTAGLANSLVIDSSIAKALLEIPE